MLLIDHKYGIFDFYEENIITICVQQYNVHTMAALLIKIFNLVMPCFRHMINMQFT